jgi:uncharacterized protein (DUF488 family)
VRAYPASRRHPQFARERLAAALEADLIGYDWQGKALGGFRQAGEQSEHTALKHPMFRGYAEHMASAEFAAAMDELRSAARRERICLMCAESDPAHCHRSLIADWLVARGERVVHLLEAEKQREHALSPLAVLEEGRLVYRGAQRNLL